jgi:hypothetical protein
MLCRRWPWRCRDRPGKGVPEPVEVQVRVLSLPAVLCGVLGCPITSFRSTKGRGFPWYTGNGNRAFVLLHQRAVVPTPGLVTLTQCARHVSMPLTLAFLWRPATYPTVAVAQSATSSQPAYCQPECCPVFSSNVKKQTMNVRHVCFAVQSITNDTQDGGRHGDLS